VSSPVVHFEIYGDGDDPGPLADFYNELFGWTAVVTGEPSYLDIDTGTTEGIAGGIGAAPGIALVSVYAAVDDVQATLDKAEELGGKVVTQVTNAGPKMQVADVADPEGNVLGLVSRGPLAARRKSTGTHPVIHFEILGSDQPTIRDFWVNLLNWETEDLPDYNFSTVLAEPPGVEGGIGRSSDGKGLVTFYVKADDPQAILHKVEELGGTTVRPVAETADGRHFAKFADPEGNIIGLLG
jgi:predicted enzyme related to lactoylglutathione lyase